MSIQKRVDICSRQFVDTQILSYAHSGHKPLPHALLAVSSVVASEFLLAYSDNPTRARYYITWRDRQPGALPSCTLRTRQNLGTLDMRKWTADRVLINFGTDFPPRVEFNRISLASAVNACSRRTIASALDGRNIPQRRLILDRFEFLADNKIFCRSITNNEIELALNLLASFLTQHQVKANFHNSFNDLMILATAAHTKTTLHTEDNLLARFTARKYGVPPAALSSSLLLDFSANPKTDRLSPRESKGYINRGWRVMFGNRSHGLR